MQIQKGTVWHTYTTQSPAYDSAEETASKLIETGMFLAILTPDNTFKCLSGSNVLSTKLSMQYENNGLGVRVDGVQHLDELGVCNLTANAFFNCINLRLSENKLFYITEQPYCGNIICCQKPFLIKTKEDEFFLLPIIRLYQNGIAHITFIDEERYNNELSFFIDSKINLPFKPSNSIIASIEYTNKSIELDYCSMNLFRRKLTKKVLSAQFRDLEIKSKEISDDDLIINGRYIDYAKEFEIQNTLSDIARTTIAVIHNTLKKKTLKGFIFGNKTTDFYHGWQGKPNIYIFSHDNQKSNAIRNERYNKELISSLLGKSTFFIDEKGKQSHFDYRAFNDFNYYSEQGVTLTLCSKKTGSEYFPETYTESNLIWDNQVKSDLRDYISFFYESKIEQIKNESSHISLATIQEEIIQFEEWLRVFSKKYGEIQELIFKNIKSNDLELARKNLAKMLASRMHVIKLKDASKSEASNRNITIAFGLVASNSLSPVIIKPFFEKLGLTKIISNYKLENYSETIYYIFAVILVLASLWLVNKLNKK
ncbi:hypothetical protein [Klebsiella pneumoniae]|uniref:hypothetical protein n=1 Tax=Klebsiella pneumoniae TaxID=573 RepID=UPI00247FBD1C|nr:hypothetical protein [Klebsiella pneumoniae]